MKESFHHFIRRLGVLCLEDAILHPALPIVVWFTAASASTHNQFRLTEAHVNVLLCIVYELAAVPVRDPMSVHGLGNIAPPSFQDTKRLAGISDRSLVRALLARASFGGMRCDVAMFHYYAESWMKRLSGLDSRPVCRSRGQRRQCSTAINVSMADLAASDIDSRISDNTTKELPYYRIFRHHDPSNQVPAPRIDGWCI
jgi:hypothetical protein